MSLYAGTIRSTTGIRGCDKEGNKVINFTVKTTKTLVGSVKIAVLRTVALFRDEAISADALKVGNHVVFGSITRNPRSYETLRGTTVEVVDMIANSFEVIPAKDFKENEEELMKMNVDEKEFVFTDADRVLCEEAKAAKKAAGTDAALPFD